MNRRIKQRGGRLTRKLICSLAAVMMLVGLSVFAAASLTDEETCPNHTEHDEACGYVEAKDSQEGHPCEHVCAVCDPALELEEKKDTYDKYAEGEQHKEINIIYKKNHDSLQDLQTYVYNEEGARGEDEQGEWMKVSLTKDIDYVVSAVPENEDYEQITFKNNYLDSLYQLPYTYILEFESGNPQEYELTIADTTPEEVPEDGATNEPIPDDSQVEDTQKEPEGETNVERGATPRIGGYEITMSSSTMEENDTTYRFTNAESNGTLTLNLNLQTSGEKERYVIIQMPEYGMVLGNTLPSAGQGVKKVTKQDERTLRLDIDDNVDESLNIQIAYVKKAVTVEMEKAWRQGNVPPATGFAVQIYGKVGAQVTELASITYGNWKIDTSGNPSKLASLKTKKMIGRLNPTHWTYDLGHAVITDTEISQIIEFNPSEGLYGGIGTENLQAEYIKGFRMYADEVLLKSMFTDKLTLSDLLRQHYSIVPGVQVDEKGSYMEFVLKENAIGYSNFSSSGNFAIAQLRLQFNTYFMGKLQPGQIYKVEYETTVGKYTQEGIEEETRSYDIAEWTVRNEETKDGFLPSYSAFKNIYNPIYNESQSRGYRLIKGEPWSITMAGFINIGYPEGTIQYSPEDYYEGLTEEYEFPYELQPKNMNYKYAQRFLNSEFGEIKEVTYELSDGTTKNAIINTQAINGVNHYWIADFDVPEGERVTKVKIVWDKYYQFIKDVGVRQLVAEQSRWTFDINVMEKKEDGSEIEDSYMAHVQNTFTKGDGSIVAQNTEKDLCFSFMDQLLTCPAADWHNNSFYEYERVYANDQVKTLNNSPRITVGRSDFTDPPKYAMRDRLNNPKLAIRWMQPTQSGKWPSVELKQLDGTPEELAGYFHTGKMKVYPKLAGWTVTYHTREKGEQTITLPEVIPDTGYDMVLPVDEGDRLMGFLHSSGIGYSIVEFSKEGEVSGWREAEGTTLVSDVEVTYPKNKDDGTPLDKDGFETGLYGVGKGDALITSDSCPKDEQIGSIRHDHTHTDSTEQQKAFVSTALRDMKIVMNKEDISVDSEQGIYQDATAEIKIGGKLTVKRTDEEKYGGFNATPSAKYNDVNMPVAGLEKEYWKEAKPVVYAKLVHPNVTWLGGRGTIQIKAFIINAAGTISSNAYKTYEVPADITMIADENGGIWLKFEAQQSVKIAIHQANVAVGTNLDIQAQTELYAYPGAQLGSNQQVIGDVYIDEQFDEWEAAYQGKDEQHNTLLEVQDRVADELNLRETGDVTTPTLYKYEEGAKMNILQKVLVGIRVIPGISNSYAMDTREIEFYPNQQNSLTSMITISSDNDDLKDYTTVLELPEKGKEMLGKVYGSDSGEGDVKRTSEFTAGLRSGVTVESNATNVTPTYRYRINGTWYTQDQMESSNNWNAVQAVEVTMSTIPKNTSITLGLKMQAEDKADLTDRKGYLGGTFNYGTAGGSSEGVLTFANYIYHPYIIEGNVFKDTDESGLKNGSEKGMKDITVNLMDKNSDEPIATVTTDIDGNYQIPTLVYRNLYLMITMPDGSKLTKQSEDTAEVSDKDSDFDRETNQYMGFPNRLEEGKYTISAGIINLPTIDAPDMTVRMEEPMNKSATATWEKATPTIQFEQALDTTIASVDSIAEGNSGTITPVAVGSTTAVAWVENSLGDRVEKTYTITVVPREVAISLTKSLTNVADSDYAFVFKVEKLSDADGSVEQTFYQTLRIQQGNSSTSVVIRKLYPGTYRFTELESNWRYGVVGALGQDVAATEPDITTPVQFTNQLNNELWSSANAVTTNNMQSITQ